MISSLYVSRGKTGFHSASCAGMRFRIMLQKHQALLRRLVRLPSMSIPILLAESERLFT